MVNLNECKIYKTEEEAQYAMVEKFADDLLHYADECGRQAVDYFFTHIPLPYGLKQ